MSAATQETRQGLIGPWRQGPQGPIVRGSGFACTREAANPGNRSLSRDQGPEGPIQSFLGLTRARKEGQPGNRPLRSLIGPCPVIHTLWMATR